MKKGNFIWTGKGKFIFPLFFFIFLFSVTGYCQYPIPSFNVSVAKDAYFLESNHTLKAPMEKRVLVIHVFCTTLLPATCKATIWVCSLDGRTVMGPYILFGGDTIYVDIDEREWGVIVDTESEVKVDVWIEGSKSIMK